jgi:hypothetical protein
MRQIAQTKHVRIDAGVYKRLQALSQKTGMSAAEIATFCVEDCLNAYEARKAITPRVLLIMNVIEGGAKFDEEGGKLV